MMKRMLLAATLTILALPPLAEAQFYGRNGVVVGGKPLYYGNPGYYSMLYGGAYNQGSAYGQFNAVTPYRPFNTVTPSYAPLGAVAPMPVSPGAAYVPSAYNAPYRGFFGPQYRRLR